MAKGDPPVSSPTKGTPAPTPAPVPAPRGTGFRAFNFTLAAVAAQAQQTKKDIEDVAKAAKDSNPSDMLAALGSGDQVDVAGLLSRSDQAGYAKAIEGGPFGQYLDEIARILKTLTENKALTAADIARNSRLTDAMRTYETIIKRYGGDAGRKFSFDQLRTEIQKLVRAQEAAARSSSKGTSGTLGKTPVREPVSSFGTSLLTASGGLR